MQEVGRAATRLLIKMIEDPTSTPQQILFDTELVIRSSCIQR
jgi:DNA-binding LacI/PurR family transcriptional regulator